MVIPTKAEIQRKHLKNKQIINVCVHFSFIENMAFFRKLLHPHVPRLPEHGNDREGIVNDKRGL